MGNRLEFWYWITSHLGHAFHMHHLVMILVIHQFFGKGLLDFLVDFVHNGRKVIVKFQLEFLVVASALIRRSSFQNLRQPKKYFALSPLPFSEEIVIVASHKAVIDVVFWRGPTPSRISFFVYLHTQLFYLVVLRFKTFFIWFFSASKRLLTFICALQTARFKRRGHQNGFFVWTTFNHQILYYYRATHSFAL